MTDLFHDVRFGMRTLAARPGFTAIAVLVLAIGIGANSAVFSVVNAVLLRPIPFTDSARLVLFWNRSPGLNIAQDWLSPAEYFDVKDQTQVFEDAAIAFVNTYNLSTFSPDGDSRPERVGGATVSASLFSLLGCDPSAGRAFLPEDEVYGAARTAIISDSLWRRRFAADTHLLGQSIMVDGVDYTVVGIIPRDFALNNETLPAYHPVQNIDVLMPLRLPATAANDRDHEDYTVIARLKKGVTPARAQAAVDTVTARLRQDFSDHYPSNSGFTISVVPMLEHSVKDVKVALLVLTGAVGLVLLIACANVAGLLLSRGETRKQEIAIRTALGASRPRLIRQFLTENLLLSLIGGALGLLLALWGISGMRSLNPGNVPRVAEINIDPRVLAFALVTTVLTGVVFGLVPALKGSQVNVSESLKESGRDSHGGAASRRARGAVVVAEVAISLILLTGAGLLVRSFSRLQAVDPGFSAAGVLSMRLSLAGPKYAKAPQRAEFYRRLWDKLQNLPGVQSVGGVTELPLSADLAWTPIWVEGYTPRPGETLVQSDLHIATTDYFHTMEIPLVSGRYFDEHDARDGQKVAIVDEGFAAQLLPGQDPLGKRLKLGSQSSNQSWMTIVGVVKSVKHYGLDAAPRITCYFAHSQFPSPGLYVVVRGSTISGLPAAVTAEVAGLDPDLPIYDAGMMDKRVAQSLARRRFSMLVMFGFAAIATLLAVIGLYGVISYSAAQRTHEIGIRIALGAGPRDVMREVVREGMTLVVAGLGLGLVAALSLTRLMAGMLYEVKPYDPLTFLVVSVLLVSVATLAEFIPARRASAVDPMVALRT